MIDERMATRRWAMGDSFTLADCAAAPALFYADKVLPFGAHANVGAVSRAPSGASSYARVLAEAAALFGAVSPTPDEARDLPYAS